MKRTRGFTIVEMLVVVVIILVMVTSSISILSVFMRGQAIKQAGRLVNAQFMQARQRATSEKVLYFVLLDPLKDTMTMYKDTNFSKSYEVGVDERVGEEAPLVKTIRFEAAGPGSLMMASPGPVYIKFYPDGSCILPTADVGYAPDAGGPTADLILWQPGQNHKLYIDISPSTGKIRKQAYRV